MSSHQDSSSLRFSGNFTQQEGMPEDAITAALDTLKHGRLHRYNTAADEVSETAAFEHEFALSVGADFCLACASGGYALHIALRAWGLESGEPVLTNAFTLSPVPGAIHNAGGKPVLVGTTRDLTIDLKDLEACIESSKARVLMLSHMRGHLVNMDDLLTILQRHNVSLIEDCAHTMGAAWDGIPSGRFGVAACYSTQTYKHINSGEGGLLVSNQPELMARAIILSGSYMLYERHDARPPIEVFESVKLETPNLSGRMDNLRSAILRPQLRSLNANVARWNARYQALAAALGESNRIYLPQRDARESFVGSSLQFLLEDIATDSATQLLERCLQRGVELKWFGGATPTGYTSQYSSWHYIESRRTLPETDKILAGLFDLRLPLTFSIEDCTIIGRIIADEVRHLP